MTRTMMRTMIAVMVVMVSLVGLMVLVSKALATERECVNMRDRIRAQILLLEEQVSPEICECCSIVNRKSDLCEEKLCTYEGDGAGIVLLTGRNEITLFVWEGSYERNVERLVGVL